MGLKLAANTQQSLAIKAIKILHSLKLYCHGQGDMGEERVRPSNSN